MFISNEISLIDVARHSVSITVPLQFIAVYRMISLDTSTLIVIVAR